MSNVRTVLSDGSSAGVGKKNLKKRRHVAIDTCSQASAGRKSFTMVALEMGGTRNGS